MTLGAPEGPGQTPAYLWLPGNEEKKIPALYQVGEDGGVEIELLAALAPDGPSNHLPVVMAQVGSVDATLYDCHLTMDFGGGWRGERPRHQTWLVTSSIEGGHFVSQDAALFDRVQITCPPLASWAGKDALDWCYEPHDDGTVTDVLRWTDQNPETAAVPGARIELHTVLDYKSMAFGDKTVQQRQVFTITADEPATYDSLWGRYVRPLGDLMSLIMDEPVRMEVVGVALSAQEGRPSRCVVRRHVRPTPDKTVDPFRMLWTLRDWDFAAGIAKWFEIDAAAPAAAMLLGGARPVQAHWSLLNFLSAVGAAEALHRGLYDTAAPNERHTAKLEAIYQRVNSKQRAWLKWKLGHSHEPTLKDRLIQLVEDTGHPAVQFLPLDVHSWAQDLVDARNRLAHGRREAVDVARDPVRLALMTDTLVAVLALRLMRELGFDEARTTELTVHHMQWWAEAASRLR